MSEQYSRGLISDKTEAIKGNHKMKKYQHKNGRGNLMRVEQKDGPKSPVLFGDACIGGRNYKIRGRKDTTKSVNPIVNLTFRPEDEERPAVDDDIGI
jgi:hypothetical protein